MQFVPPEPGGGKLCVEFVQYVTLHVMTRDEKMLTLGHDYTLRGSVEDSPPFLTTHPLDATNWPKGSISPEGV